MSLTTQLLTVLDCSITNINGFPRNISFALQPVSQAYLGALSITESTTNPGYTGSVVIGSKQAPSVTAITMGTALFDPLFSFVGVHSGLQVQVTSTNLLVVTDVACTSTRPQLARESTLLQIQNTLGTGNIGTSLETLNETARALLHAVTQLTSVLGHHSRIMESSYPPRAAESAPPINPEEPC